jgi:hypothetical protein
MARCGGAAGVYPAVEGDPADMIRERISRAISRTFLGRDEMLSSIAEWHRWRSRHIINALFLDRNHCRSCAEYDARLMQREITLVDLARRDGLL